MTLWGTLLVRRNMGKLIDITGRRYDKLVVLSYENSKKSKGGHAARHWRCKCDCGQEIVLRYDILKYRPNRSCGCNSRKSDSTKYGSRSLVWKGIGDISNSYYRNLCGNAKQREFEINVDIAYLWNLFLKQGKKCALTGIPLMFNTRDYKHDGNASLDRIDSKQGYIEGNLQWVHKDINRMKQHYNEQYFIEMCKKVIEYNAQILQRD